MPKYSELLKDPRWQKKRLEILQRDNFTCIVCGDTKSELHVHHTLYTANPWDADSTNLVTLCKLCHRIEESMRKTNDLIEVLNDNGTPQTMVLFKLYGDEKYIKLLTAIKNAEAIH